MAFDWFDPSVLSFDISINCIYSLKKVPLHWISISSWHSIYINEHYSFVCICISSDRTNKVQYNRTLIVRTKACFAYVWHTIICGICQLLFDFSSFASKKKHVSRTRGLYVVLRFNFLVEHWLKVKREKTYSVLFIDEEATRERQELIRHRRPKITVISCFRSEYIRYLHAVIITEYAIAVSALRRHHTFFVSLSWYIYLFFALKNKFILFIE